MAKLIGREGERLAVLSTAVGAAGAKVVVGFTVRDGAAPVELTEMTRVSVVARMNAYEIRHGCRADRRLWLRKYHDRQAVLLSSAGTQPYSRFRCSLPGEVCVQRSIVATRGSADLENAP